MFSNGFFLVLIPLLFVAILAPVLRLVVLPTHQLNVAKLFRRQLALLLLLRRRLHCRCRHLLSLLTLLWRVVRGVTATEGALTAHATTKPHAATACVWVSRYATPHEA